MIPGITKKGRSLTVHYIDPLRKVIDSGSFSATMLEWFSKNGADFCMSYNQNNSPSARFPKNRYVTVEVFFRNPKELVSTLSARSHVPSLLALFIALSSSAPFLQ